MNTRIICKENLKFLVRRCRTQTALANNLKQKLTQPVISAILRSKNGRHLGLHEARLIEDE